MPSTVIRSFNYLADIETLIVTFISGARYKYFKVTEKEYEDLKNAFSKGTHFNKHIKPNHDYEKLTA